MVVGVLVRHVGDLSRRHVKLQEHVLAGVGHGGLCHLVGGTVIVGIAQHHVHILVAHCWLKVDIAPPRLIANEGFGLI